MSTRCFLLAVAILLAAPPAAQKASAQEYPTWLELDAPAAFATIEANLLAVPHTAFNIEATAGGALAVELRGGLRLGPHNAVRLHTEGSFGGASVAPALLSDGVQMRGGPRGWRDAAFQEDAPPGLRTALVVGLTRMGLLHNLALLSAGRPPDQAAGDVTQWVTVHDIVWSDEPTRDGLVAPALAFSIRVDGRDVATATLWLDPSTGLPLLRRQQVAFPGGTMEVEERYAGWRFDPAAAGAFSLE